MLYVAFSYVDTKKKKKHNGKDSIAHHVRLIES